MPANQIVMGFCHRGRMPKKAPDSPRVFRCGRGEYRIFPQIHMIDVPFGLIISNAGRNCTQFLTAF